ncbi:hypothetical protein CEXT_4931 [Caerostris extrusa]|uniref:Uncharacterized protein n=1 Tax=Caerostris extrusa TaxID=172846 RepID=A0AAV4WAE8_CAEEX|nr:hypothetical protein CEXT_4931 [Caerostris extrusa]
MHALYSRLIAGDKALVKHRSQRNKENFFAVPESKDTQTFYPESQNLNPIDQSLLQSRENKRPSSHLRELNFLVVLLSPIFGLLLVFHEPLVVEHHSCSSSFFFCAAVPPHPLAIDDPPSPVNDLRRSALDGWASAGNVARGSEKGCVVSLLRAVTDYDFHSLNVAVPVMPFLSHPLLEQ